MDINKYFEEISNHMEAVRSRVLFLDTEQRKGRSKKELEEYLEVVSSLLAEVGVVIFELRYLSWSIFQKYREAGSPAMVQFSYQGVRDEIKENIYSLIQLSATLQERTRSVRAMYSGF